MTIDDDDLKMRLSLEAGALASEYEQNLVAYYTATYPHASARELSAFRTMAVLLGSLGYGLLSDDQILLTADLVHRLWSRS